MDEKADLIKHITTIAAPVSKLLIESQVKPKLQELLSKYNRQKKIIEHVIYDKFSIYLSEAYTKNSLINTLVFGNQPKLLDTIYVPLEVTSVETSRKRYKIENYDRNFIPFYQRVLITDTAGMGKSTMLKKIFTAIINQNAGVPFIIELRRLTKDRKIIDELLDQLKPINEEIDKVLLLDLIKKGGFIFLLDGFDEIALEERKSVTLEIRKFIDKATDNYFVITSRPEAALTAFGDFLQFKVRPLSLEEAYELLRKYNGYGDLSETLIKKLKENSNKSINEFLTNPLLVSLLYTAFEHKQTIPFKKHIFYRQVYDAFFENHDLTKGDSFQRDKLSSLDIDDFHRVLRYIGYLCLIKGRIEYTKDELLPLIRSAKEFTLLHFRESDFLNDLIKTVPLFTIDGMYYKWAHKSLQEYFAAQFIYSDAKEKQAEILVKISTHQEVEKYLNILDLYFSIDYKSFREVVVANLLAEYFAFLKNSYKYLPDSPSKRERQQLTFYNDYIIVKVKRFDSIDDDEWVDTVFELVESKYNDFDGTLADRTFDEEILFDSVKVVEHETPKGILTTFLYRKNEPFVKLHKQKSALSALRINIPENQPFFVNDRKNSLANTEENFESVTRVIRDYPHNVNGFAMLDDAKCLKLLNDIKKSAKNKEYDSLLDF